jgi:hypothetical protein
MIARRPTLAGDAETPTGSEHSRKPEHIAWQLRLPGRPHVEFAVVFLLMNSAMFASVSLGCTVLFLASLNT